MTRFVIDAVALIELSGRPIPTRHQLLAPNSIRSQALDVLLREVASGRLDERAALARHERLTETKVRLLADRVSRRTAWTIAREHGWPSVREAEYVALTRLQGDALVCLDPELTRTVAGLVPLATLADVLADRDPP